MNFDDFKQLISSAGFPAAEAEFKKPVKAPYIAYLKGVDRSFWANGKPVIPRYEVIVELYTDKGDVASQPKLEQWFKENSLPFEMSERQWIVDENLYMTEYKVELM